MTSRFTFTLTPAISSGFDAQYTMDNLNRLTKDEQGSWSGSAITSRSRQQIWTLDQVGNWNLNRVDRNGDNDFIDPPTEVDDQRTHNNVNELLTRDVDSDTNVDYTLAYNLRGDMTDDGQHYEYVYDGFGRLRQVKNQDTPTPKLVAEYWYNGLGHRKSWKYDTDVDGDVDGSDKTFHWAYDERWRVVATYRESDTNPKEQFIYHCAGADGMGGSSYIDAVILREQDANSNWVTSGGDGTLEKRDYYCQNWRSDVVCMITASGTMGGWVKYSAYGIPYGIPTLDTNGDGTVDSTDGTNITNWAGTGAGVTNPTADYNLDGNINSTDSTFYTTRQLGISLGWGKLAQASATGGAAAGANRKGYAGYEFDPVLADSNWHVRHRVLKSDLGRWTRRDPLGYVDGPNSFVYTLSSPLVTNDPSGLVITIERIHNAQGSCAGARSSCEWHFRRPGFFMNTNRGFFVQKLTFTRTCRNCGDCYEPWTSDDDCGAIYEFFPATNIMLNGNRVIRTLLPDEFSTSHDARWGDVSIKGEVRYFNEGTAHTYPTPGANGWNAPGFVSCGECPLIVHLNTYSLTQPTFWNSPLDGPAFHDFSSFWKCCDSQGWANYNCSP